jgi:hypothetical protein
MNDVVPSYTVATKFELFFISVTFCTTSPESVIDGNVKPLVLEEDGPTRTCELPL